MLPGIRLYIVICLLVLGRSAPLLAHDSEPINTEFAAPFALRAGNIQFGYQYLRGDKAYTTIPVTLEYGFYRRMQFSVTMPIDRHDEPGQTLVRPGNIEVGYRFLLAGGSGRWFALSINPEASLPTGDKRVTERAYGLGAALHLDTHPFSRLWTHTNLGYETPVAHFDEKEKNFLYKFAAMYEASEQVRPVVELIGEHDFHSSQTRSAVVPEIIYAPNHRWEIKAGVPLGVTAETPDIGVQLQVTWKFGAGRQ